MTTPSKPNKPSRTAPAKWREGYGTDIDDILNPYDRPNVRRAPLTGRRVG